MLVGVRKWWVETDSSSPVKLRVITEAYEQRRGVLNDIGYVHAGGAAANVIWENYLSNIGAHWAQSVPGAEYDYLEDRVVRSEEHTSELQSLRHIVRRL